MHIYYDSEEIGPLSIPKSVRDAVRERDNHRCQLTGWGHDLSLHHIIAASHGGPASVANLITVNRSIHDILHLENIPADLYHARNLYLLTRINILRDILRTRRVPDHVDGPYVFVRAMYDLGPNKCDPDLPIFEGARNAWTPWA